MRSELTQKLTTVLISNLLLNGLDRVTRVDTECKRFAAQRFHEDLHLTHLSPQSLSGSLYLSEVVDVQKNI